jgi:hypothetical protein
MRLPWANVALLVLIGVESISGLLGPITGDSDLARYIQIHRLTGYGTLAIVGWKAFNITSSLGGRRKIGPRLTSLALAGTLFGVQTLGFFDRGLGRSGLHGLAV